MATADVERAKNDLIAKGEDLTGPCGALKITNLVASRMGLKLLQKLSGERCKDRTMDVVIENGRIIDCLIRGGGEIDPNGNYIPGTGNGPAWQDQGPQTSVQKAMDPFPIDDVVPGPDPNPGDLPARVAALETLTAQQTTAIQSLNARVASLEAVAGNLNSLRFNLENVQLTLIPVGE